MNQSCPTGRRLYAGVGLTTLGTLLLELALTRIFSVVFYYHFAFLAISIALFGLGAGGVFSYVVAGWKRPFFAKLGAVAAFNAALALAALVVVLELRGEMGYATLALVYFTSALPFFAAGATISLVIAETIERVDRVYFADLAGAAAGCLLLIPLLDTLGGPNTVIAAALIYALSALVWFSMAASRRGLGAAGVLAGAIAALLVVNSFVPLIGVKYAKGKELAGERFVRWNSFSRVALSREKGTGMPNIVIDADAATGIPGFDFARLSDKDRGDLLYQGPGLVYVLRPGAKALVIGAGGGWDLARGLASGCRDITGVEINPIIATTIMRERFPDLSRRLYFRPEVRIRVEDGRSFVRRTDERYGVIQMTLVDTWASTAAGAFALSENNLYTSDAFYEYFSHLEPDGVLVFTRWGLDPPRESLRLISLARAALARLGETDLARHVIVVREGGAAALASWGATDTVLFGRSVFTPSDIARLRAAQPHGHFHFLYLPDETIPNAFTGLVRSPDPAAFERAYRYDVSAVDDNRPFFFYAVQPRDVWNFLKNASRLSADYNVNRAVPLLFGLLIVSALATGIVLGLPRLLLGSRLPSGRGIQRFLWYFIFLGAGYILIQVALVQKFVLFLGHPTYALTVIIFSMLVSSGLGSYFSGGIARSDARLKAVLAAIALLVAALAVSVSPVLAAGVGLPIAVKFAISVLLIAPAGFLMGVPFPSGLRRLEAMHKPSVRWAWSLNAAASVLGSVAAIVLAIYLGLRETLLTGGGMYLCALVVLALGGRRRVTSAPEALAEPQVSS
jgi:hypothetical protein